MNTYADVNAVSLIFENERDLKLTIANLNMLLRNKRDKRGKKIKTLWPASYTMFNPAVPMSAIDAHAARAIGRVPTHRLDFKHFGAPIKIEERKSRP